MKKIRILLFLLLQNAAALFITNRGKSILQILLTPLSKTSRKERPDTTALVEEADLVECALNNFVLIPASPKNVLTRS